MPDVRLLIELLEAICDDPAKTRELSMLLKKISRTTAHVHIDVDYNGREFFWKIPLQNPTAGEFSPRDLREKKIDSYTK